MKCKNSIGEYLRSLKASPILGRQVVFHREVSATESCFNSPARPWSDEMQGLLEGSGISRLYSHQVSAIDLIRSGRHVVVSTPTASGKTMVIFINPEDGAARTWPLPGIYSFTDIKKAICFS